VESADGPCTILYSLNTHCGASFLPNPANQAHYLSANMGPCSAGGGMKGVSNIKTDIPWAIFLGRIIGQYLATDGIGGHTGPFVGRDSLEVRGIRIWVIQALQLRGQKGVAIWRRFVHKGHSFLVQLHQDQKR
jgi:hypothetical protein